MVPVVANSLELKSTILSAWHPVGTLTFLAGLVNESKCLLESLHQILILLITDRQVLVHKSAWKAGLQLATCLQYVGDACCLQDTQAAFCLLGTNVQPAPDLARGVQARLLLAACCCREQKGLCWHTVHSCCHRSCPVNCGVVSKDTVTYVLCRCCGHGTACFGVVRR